MSTAPLWLAGAGAAFAMSVVHLVAIALEKSRPYHLIRLAAWASLSLIMVAMMEPPAIHPPVATALKFFLACSVALALGLMVGLSLRIPAWWILLGGVFAGGWVEFTGLVKGNGVGGLDGIFPRGNPDAGIVLLGLLLALTIAAVLAPWMIGRQLARHRRRRSKRWEPPAAPAPRRIVLRWMGLLLLACVCYSVMVLWLLPDHLAQLDPEGVPEVKAMPSHPVVKVSGTGFPPGSSACPASKGRLKNRSPRGTGVLQRAATEQPRIPAGASITVRAHAQMPRAARHRRRGGENIG